MKPQSLQSPWPLAGVMRVLRAKVPKKSKRRFLGPSSAPESKMVEKQLKRVDMVEQKVGFDSALTV